MLKLIFTESLLIILLFSGCASNTGPEYDADSYSQMKTVQTGVVIQSRPVVIKDDRSGKLIGTIVGTVLGSTIGSNDGTTLAMLGGGLVGRYAGNEIGKSNASELTIELDTGETVVVVAKVVNILAGDRVKIIKDGNKVATVDVLY